MTHEFVTLSAQDPDSAVTCDRGVSLLSLIHNTEPTRLQLIS
jgi:hypothetical protein